MSQIKTQGTFDKQQDAIFIKKRKKNYNVTIFFFLGNWDSQNMLSNDTNKNTYN